MLTTARGYPYPEDTDQVDVALHIKNLAEAIDTDATAELSPAGVISDYIGIVAPLGWLLMEGQTIFGGETLYPALWSVLPVSMKAGSNIVLPDTRGRVVVTRNASDTDFDTIGEIGGAKLTQLAIHTHTGPAHNHPITVDANNGNTGAVSSDHSHAFNVNSGIQVNDTHTHYAAPGNQFIQANVNPGSGVWFQFVPGGWNIFNDQLTGTFFTGTHYHNVQGSTGGISSNHSHSLAHGHTASSGSAGTGATGPAGVANPVGNVPPFIVFSKIIKAH